MFSFVFGIVLLQCFSVLPSFLWFLLAAVIFIACCFFKNRVVKKISIVLFAFCLGLVWAVFQAGFALSKKLPESDFGKTVLLRGWVASIPKKMSLGVQFEFRLSKVGGKSRNGLVQLSWYRRSRFVSRALLKGLDTAVKPRDDGRRKSWHGVKWESRHGGSRRLRDDGQWESRHGRSRRLWDGGKWESGHGGSRRLRDDGKWESGHGGSQKLRDERKRKLRYSGRQKSGYGVPGLRVGDEWLLPVKLKHIRGLVNPGGFDYQRFAFMRGIVAKGYVVARGYPHFIRHHAWKYPITTYRSKLQHVIQQAVKKSHDTAILTALSIGSKSLITPELWQVFQRTGTSHLVAISGLHVGMVAAAVYFLLSWLWRCFPRFLLYVPAQRMGAVAAILAVFSYGFLVGFSLPTERAVIMVSVLMLLQLFSWHVLFWKRLLLAFVIVVALQPLALFSASFWLSFSAVFWIAYAVTNKRWWRLQLAVFLGLMPLSLFYFHQISLLSVVANMVAIPWVTVLLVPICLLACIVYLFSSGVAGFLFFIAEKVLVPLWWFLQWLSHFSFAVWAHPVHSLFVLFFLLLAVVLFFAPRGFPSRYLAFIFLMPFFFIKTLRPKTGDVWLTLLDVGQGLSAVVQTAHHVLVYDTGPKYPTGFNAGRSVVVPYLQDVDVTRVNRLMISHGDNDHVGGARWLLAMMPVDSLMTSVPPSHWHRPVQACFSGESWQWDQVSFHVLSPPKGLPYEDNNSSCVLRIEAGAHSILLTGDIEKPTEKVLLRHQKTNLRSTILISPHHGSRSSSSVAFVKAVHPRYVLIPVGYENRYHFPAVSVLQRYRAIGAQIFTTAKQGAIQMHVPKLGSISVTTAYHRRHYWQ